MGGLGVEGQCGGGETREGERQRLEGSVGRVTGMSAVSAVSSVGPVTGGERRRSCWWERWERDWR